MRFTIFLSILLVMASCNAQSDEIKTGADQVDLVLSELEGKNIAIVANHTSIVCPMAIKLLNRS